MTNGWDWSDVEFFGLIDRNYTDEERDALQDIINEDEAMRYFQAARVALNKLTDKALMVLSEEAWAEALATELRDVESLIGRDDDE